MTRFRVEALLSAFPKLMESGRDHTFIETETVRYVYEPMGALYMLLVTNKASNILEDLVTLRLLARVVQDCCDFQVNEEIVLKNAFSLVFAFDEVVSFGHRENVTISQVKMYTDMDSQEEKGAKILEQSKINEAREYAKKKQIQLANLHAPQSGSSENSLERPSMPSFGNRSLEHKSLRMDSSSNGHSMQMSPSPSPYAMMLSDGPEPLQPKAPTKGMVLLKKQPVDPFASLSMTEPSPVDAVQEDAVAAQKAPAVANPLTDLLKVEIDEQIKAKLEVEGSLQGELECVGDFRVTVFDTSKADLACFKLAPQDQSFKYKMHPNLNKVSQANNILEVRDASKRYKANMPVPLLKWRSTSTSEADLPMSLSCWPSATADGSQIVLEYELLATDTALEDVHIVFPCPPNARTSISCAQPGQATYDPGNQQVRWTIPSIDLSEGSCGTLEFNTTADIASLLPYRFTAVRRGQTKCPMDVLECYHQSDNSIINFALEKTCTYTVTVGA
jgi:hypothetical protein